MKRDHYEFVTKHFNLSKFSTGNGADFWHENFEGQFCVQDLVHRISINGTYGIISSQRSPDQQLFVALPSKQFAHKIIRFAQKTEILFI